MRTLWPWTESNYSHVGPVKDLLKAPFTLASTKESHHVMPEPQRAVSPNRHVFHQSFSYTIVLRLIRRRFLDTNPKIQISLLEHGLSNTGSPSQRIRLIREPSNCRPGDVYIEPLN
eukprot:5610049-Amphidinium_carterae.1